LTIHRPVTEEMTPLCKVDATLPGVRGCAMPVVSMSKEEFDRLEVLLGVQSGRLRVADACELLSLKRRQVFRLLARFETRRRRQPGLEATRPAEQQPSA
jgi:hypothetical protein